MCMLTKEISIGDKQRFDALKKWWRAHGQNTRFCFWPLHYLAVVRIPSVRLRTWLS